MFRVGWRGGRGKSVGVDKVRLICERIDCLIRVSFLDRSIVDEHGNIIIYVANYIRKIGSFLLENYYR